MNRIAIVTALAMAGNVHLCAADVARAGTEIDFAKIPDVRIFKGDETIGYRDPAAWYEDGVFHLFVTVCDPSVPRMTIGHSTSRNLVDWSPIEYVLPMDKRFNWSSPGNIVKDGDERVLCFQKYPTPDATPTKVAFADDTARLYTIRTKDFKTWTKPELIMVKGPNVSEAEMGRMIDAYIAKGTDGLWWCFYKQQQDKSGKFSKKARMGVPFSVSPVYVTYVLLCPLYSAVLKHSDIILLLARSPGMRTVGATSPSLRPVKNSLPSSSTNFSLLNSKMFFPPLRSFPLIRVLRSSC